MCLGFREPQRGKWSGCGIFVANKMGESWRGTCYVMCSEVWKWIT